MNEEAYLRRVMKLNFKSGFIFSENVMGCTIGKTRILMNKPIYLRQAILDLHKIIIYEFHYGYMKLKYGANLWFCYMDANFLVYNIKIDDFYKDITSNIKAGFNTSSYSCSQVCPLPMEVNKEVIGLMKDELGGKIITEFVAFRLKLYAYKMLSGSGDKKCS